MAPPFLLALLVHAAAPPATMALPPRPLEDDALGLDDPRVEMIDFLGRRMLCARLRQVEANTTARYRAEWTRLACAQLGEEERHWRRRFADLPAALAWLDRDPERFESLMLRVHFDSGPAPGLARHVMQRGTDEEGRGRYEVSAALDGERAVFTLAQDGQPPRRFVADLAALPALDLQSLRADYRGSGEDAWRGLRVRVRYGYRQGYCRDSERDDRPNLTIWFRDGEPRAQRAVYVNCEASYMDLPDAGRER
jgi:hypothetical protein